MAAYIRDDLKPVIASTPEQTTWDIAALRGGGERLLGSAAPDLGEVELLLSEIAGGDGDPMEIRTLRVVGGEASRAVLLSIHGGGYVAGRAEYDDAKNAELAERFPAEMISPEYRLAPEHPWPAGVTDCVCAVEFAAARAAELGVPLFVFGDSAGGGLAYFASLHYSGAADGPAPIAGVILLEPCLDPRMSSASFEIYSDGPVWTRAAAAEAWRITAVTPESREQIVQLLEDPQLAALAPPCVIVVNPADPLRDEGIRLAQHLADCGVPAELHMYAGTFHGALSVPSHPVWEEIQLLMRRFMEDICLPAIGA